MRRLINKFPREVGTPRKRFCATEEDFYSFLNNQNGITGCHISIYHCDAERKYHNTVLDKIVFDFDKSDALEQTVKMHEYLKKEKIKHIMFFSGRRGFHLWMFCKDYKSINIKSDCLANAQQYFRTTLKFNIDTQLIGQLRHTIRIPNTYHLLGGRFCIPVTESDLLAGMEYIKEKARKQNFYLKFYGEKLFDLKPYDFPTLRGVMVKEMPVYDYGEVEVKDKMVRNLLPCLQLMLLEPKEFCTYESRRLFALGCREHGLSPKICKLLAKKYWGKVKDSSGTKSKYMEFIEERWVEWVYRCPEMFFPDCKVVMSRYGLCKGACKQYSATGCPLYA